MFFFFFQAEDGIRDYKVTGVQTCALPISAFCARTSDAAPTTTTTAAPTINPRSIWSNVPSTGWRYSPGFGAASASAGAGGAYRRVLRDGDRGSDSAVAPLRGSRD